MDSAHLGGVGSTYGGSPLACVAALEALKMIHSRSFWRTPIGWAT